MEGCGLRMIVRNPFINQGNICGWCNENEIEGNSECCAICEHQFEFTHDSDIDEYNELEYNERLADGFAQMQASEYQYYWS